MENLMKKLLISIVMFSSISAVASESDDIKRVLFQQLEGRKISCLSEAWGKTGRSFNQYLMMNVRKILQSKVPVVVKSDLIQPAIFSVHEHNDFEYQINYTTNEDFTKVLSIELSSVFLTKTQVNEGNIINPILVTKVTRRQFDKIKCILKR